MLIRRVSALIRQEHLIDAEDRVLVGASGGVDSSVLLSALFNIKDTFPFSIAVAHLNHSLRGAESNRDEAFVRDLAEKLGLPFHVRREDVGAYAKAKKLSLQHAGRDLRYSFFNELAREHGYARIAIAHTRDDQVETFIMRIVKGTGLRGLSSIPVRRGTIIRPLLCCYRSEIEAYAKEERIPYVEDSSNRKDLYQRNFIRNRIFPLLNEVNPNFRERVLLLLDDLTRLNVLYEDKAHCFLDTEVRSEEGEIVAPTESLKRLDPETRYRVLSGMLERCDPALVPLRDHVRLIEHALEGLKPNVRVFLPCRVTVTRAYDRLACTKEPFPPAIQGLFPITVGINVLEPFGVVLECTVLERVPESFRADNQTAFFDLDNIGELRVRTFVGGDRFVPLGMGSSVKLKDFFIASKIPLPGRRRIPLLRSGEDIIWVCGHRIDERYKVTVATRRVLHVSVRPLAV